MIEGSDLSKHELKVRLWSAVATLVIGFGILLVKFLAFHRTHSQAIYSDALESIVNVVTAIVGIAVIYYASKPADEDHPYGHGKVEYFSAAFEGGLITFAAIFIVIEAVRAQLRHATLQDLESGMWLISICAVANLVLGSALKILGKKYASATLESGGVHLLTDFGTTVGALIGLGLVQFTGLAWIDRLVAVLVGVWMAFSGLRLVIRSASGLMDAEDIPLLEQLASIFEKYAGDGIIQIHHTKMIRAGWFHHIDAHVVVPEFWSIEQAHIRLEVFESAVIKSYPYGGEANFHLDPCKRKYCSMCDYPSCPVRVAQFVKRMPVELEHLRSRDEPI